VTFYDDDVSAFLQRTCIFYLLIMKENPAVYCMFYLTEKHHVNKLVGSLTHVLLLGKEFSGHRALGQADNKIIAGRKVTSVISDRNQKSEL
jgi:hypothetical protein